MKFYILLLLCIPIQLWSQDTIPPVISNFWSDGDSIGVFTDYKSQVPKYSVIDDTDGDITAQAQIIGSVNTDSVGSYQLSIVATDKASNSTTLTVNILVVDTVAPVLVLSGDNPVCVYSGREYFDQGVTVSDNYSSAVDVVLAIGGNFVNTHTQGWYCTTYIATDVSGNQSKVLYRTAYVQLIDSAKPCDFISGKVCGKDPLSIVPFQMPTVEVYPNPTKGELTIKTKHSSNHVEVYTLTGKKIIDRQLLTSSFELKLPTSGLFYVIVHTDEGLVKQLVVVE